MPAKVFLTGFMGAGKTTVGRHLASRLGVPFVDLDDEIERRAGATIPDLFERVGEDGFRRHELEALRAVLERSEVVLATGGGTAAVEPAAEVLRAADGVTVWLDVPFEALAVRLAGSRGRPLLGTDDQTEALYRSRLDAYQACDLRVEIAEDETAEQVAARIEGLLE